MRSFLKKVCLGMASVGLLAAAASAAVTNVADYHLGEADPGATLGGAANATTVDSAGSNNLTESAGAATYAPGVASGSSLSISFPSSGGASYTGSTFDGLTTNFGIEAYFHVSALGRVTPVYNGNGGANGFGFFTGVDGSSTGVASYAGLFGGKAILSTNVPETVGDNVYIALVEQGTTPTVYLSLNGGPLQTFTTFPTAAAPVSPNDTAGSGTAFTIGGGFAGQIDETRVFTFAPGAFSVSDLNVPEPTSLAWLGAAGLLALRRRHSR